MAKRVIDDDEMNRISDEIRKDEIRYLKKEREAFEREKEAFERKKEAFERKKEALEREKEAFEREKERLSAQSIPIETLEKETLSMFNESLPKIRDKLTPFVRQYKFKPDSVSFFLGKVSYDDNPFISLEMREKFNYKPISVGLGSSNTFLIKSESRNRVKDQDGVSKRTPSRKYEILCRL